MQTAVLTQGPTTPEKDSLQCYLTGRIHKDQFDTAKVAVAYATVSGVRALLAAFNAHGLKKSSWLLGLDDAITQPGAIDLLLSLGNAEVRVASHEDADFRFHPKFFAFAHAAGSDEVLCLIGSANLTVSAFCGNAEAVAVLECQSAHDRASIDAAWKRLWAQGHVPTVAELDAYKALYKKAARVHGKYKTLIAKKKKSVGSAEVLVSDDAELDPAMANICWIECGNVTAMGRELEFKAEQGLYFGLNPSGGKSKLISLRTSEGKKTNLTMKYQGNHMWRLQMNNSVPEVKAGLRPKKKNGKRGRSPYVAIFSRNKPGGVIDLKFINLNGKDFSELRKRTIASGTLGKTSAREYGWCS